MKRGFADFGLGRRGMLAGAAAGAGLSALGPMGSAFGQAAGPWSQAPRSKVDKLNFVVWTYGDIYTQIARRFDADWGVKVDGTISSFNDHPTKLATMFAAGEKIDVSQSSPFSFPNFIEQGLVEPIDGLPGADEYIKDFTPFTKQVAQYKGKTMGLPYFSAIWVWNYNEELLEKTKVQKAFSSYEEFIEHCVKAKKDGVCRYPVLWVAGVG
ncbi:MAG: extracellular solute-binding protein, partial [Alphaproteobacteria bacterium]|nr:extracellular solute-binding protein [Alphaproteobacteria bacterium]